MFVEVKTSESFWFCRKGKIPHSRASLKLYIQNTKQSLNVYQISNICEYSFHLEKDSWLVKSNPLPLHEIATEVPILDVVEPGHLGEDQS